MDGQAPRPLAESRVLQWVDAPEIGEVPAGLARSISETVPPDILPCSTPCSVHPNDRPQADEALVRALLEHCGFSRLTQVRKRELESLREACRNEGHRGLRHFRSSRAARHRWALNGRSVGRTSRWDQNGAEHGGDNTSPKRRVGARCVRAAVAHLGGPQAKSVLEKLAEIGPPTAFEKTTYPRRPGVRRYEKIVRFSTIGPVKAGWLVRSKGLWLRTDAGRKAYEQFVDSEQLMKEAGRLYRQWAAERPQEPDAPLGEGTREGAATLEEAEEAAWTEIEEHLEQINPYDF